MFFSWLKSEKAPCDEADNAEPDMEYAFDDEVAKRLLNLIREEYGLDYKKQEYVTFRKIERFCRLNAIASFETLQASLEENDILKEKLINALTVCETYFYRESHHFDFLANLLEENPDASILSAPCSSGEEVYSILLHLKERNLSNARTKVVGIDINTQALEKARKGCYASRSVTRVPAHTLENEFVRGEKFYCIKEEHRRKSRFLKRNVFELDPEDLGTYDVVISRNMLIYFNESNKKRALERFHTLLKPGGYLFLGHADINFPPQGFLKIFDGNTIYYRKKMEL